ncbi:sigma-70 family RNA polymerase sigma factor [candidate division FCPU426 bacterium]|nr:sigma-70 family RNA polymerase sigma factor [candidate division FCPU426 bacterium]
MAENRGEKHTRLMLDFQQGDERAYRLLVTIYQNRVYALAQRFLQNRRAAAEATLAVFHKAFTARHSFRAGNGFAAWLFGLAYESCQHASAANHAADTGCREASGREEKRVTVQAVARLSPAERMALLLDHYENMTILEISEVLHMNPLAVETILCRARTSLRIKLASYLQKAGSQ